jgi:hypothetical protein
VVLDIYRKDGIVAVESEGHQTIGEEYALVDGEQSLIGLLLMWKFYVGGGGAFYSDDVIFDVTLPDDIVSRLIAIVDNKCAAASIRFERVVGVK